MTAAVEAAPQALSNAVRLDLAAYRHEHVEERIRRAMAREEVASVEALVRRLQADAAARERFRRSVAVTVSGLFRDPDQFDILERELLPPLLAGGRRLRVWSAGCADGTELYSVAIVLERLDALDRAFLLGSDLLEENIALARRGVYGDVTIADRMRTQVRWERRDLLHAGPPPGKWSLVLCRNVAIYLAPEAKRSLHEGLAKALTVGGILMLGRSERLSDAGSLGFERAAPHAYRKVR